MLFAQNLPSALSKVATRSLLCCERLLSTRVSNVTCISNVARVSLERAPVGGRRFRPTFGRMEFGNFYFCNFLIFVRRSSGLTFGDNCTSSDTSCSVPMWVSLMVALSVSRMYHHGLERKP